MILIADMTKYQTQDGAFFDAANPQELVEQLRFDSRTESEDVADFMEQTARRCKMYNRAVIRTSSCEDFVADLMAADYVKVVVE